MTVMKIQYRILLAGLSAAMLLSSCNIYRNHSRPDEVTTAGMYRDTLGGRHAARGYDLDGQPALAGGCSAILTCRA